VRVVNSYRPVLERFVACFGGTIGMHRRGDEKARMTWVWRCYGSQAADALNCLLPHLQEKRAQSYLGLHFRRLHKSDKVARECTVEALSLLKKVTHHA